MSVGQEAVPRPHLRRRSVSLVIWVVLVELRTAAAMSPLPSRTRPPPVSRSTMPGLYREWRRLRALRLSLRCLALVVRKFRWGSRDQTAMCQALWVPRTERRPLSITSNSLRPHISCKTVIPLPRRWSRRRSTTTSIALLVEVCLPSSLTFWFSHTHVSY